jgi:hypothetical protein
MNHSNRWIMGFAVVFGFIMFIPAAQAEQPFDITSCYSGKITIVSASKELTVFGIEVNGIFQSNHENKAFDNMTLHCVGVFRDMEGKAFGTSYCKGMDPDGDIVVQEHTRVVQRSPGSFCRALVNGRASRAGAQAKLSPAASRLRQARLKDAAE